MRMLNVKKMATYKIVEQSKLVSNRHFICEQYYHYSFKCRHYRYIASSYLCQWSSSIQYLQRLRGNTQTHTQTHTQTDYYNPPRLRARVNNNQLKFTLLLLIIVPAVSQYSPV